jgi:GTP-binding protein Era
VLWTLLCLLTVFVSLSFLEIVPVSAAYHIGINELLKKIVKIMPVGPKLYSSAKASDRTDSFFVSEIIRETIFELYQVCLFFLTFLLLSSHLPFLFSFCIESRTFYLFQGEIPYSSEVVIDEWKQIRKDFAQISTTIIVERKSQVGIIIGKEGCLINKLKEISIKKIQDVCLFFLC